MKQVSIALRAVAAAALTVCFAGVMAVSASATVTKTGYKYCSGSPYVVVTLQASSSKAQTHTHTVSGKKETYRQPAGHNWFLSLARGNSSNWTASTSSTFSSGPTSGCV